SQYNGDPPRWLPTAVAENLSALGHVEFAFDTNLDWVAAPPEIVGTPSAGPGRGVLCGTRTRSFVEAVDLTAKTHGVRCIKVAQDVAPTVIQLWAGSDEKLA